MNSIYTCCYLAIVCDASNFNVMLSIIKGLKVAKKKEYEDLYSNFYEHFADKSVERIPHDHKDLDLESLLSTGLKGLDYFDDNVIAFDNEIKEYPIYDEMGYNLIYSSPKLSIPKDLKIFYKINNGLVLKNNIYFRKPDKIRNATIIITNAYPDNISNCPFDRTEVEIDNEPITFINVHAYDWYGILFDVNSVDNCGGELIINLNEKSEFYGHIIAYSSSDEGVITYVAKSFSEFVRIMLQTRLEYINGKRYLGSKKVDKDDYFCDHKCASIVDHFNMFYCD